MLDSFEILTTSGVVLWSKSYVPVSNSVINGFIKDVFIEEKVLPGANVADDATAAKNPAYRKERYTLKWTSVKDLGLIFVAVYQSLLHLSWIDKLLDNIKIIFVDLYRDQLRKPHTSVVECDFDSYFEQQVRELERSAEKSPQTGPFEPPEDPTPPSSSDSLQNDMPPPPIPGLAPGKQKAFNSNSDSTDTTPLATPDSSRPTTPLAGHLLSVKPGHKVTSRRARKAATTAYVSSGDEDLRKKVKPSKNAVKKGRRWDADGIADEDDGVTLDYSTTTPNENEIEDPLSRSALEPIDSSAHGVRTRKGEYVLKDFDVSDKNHSILQQSGDAKPHDPTKVGVVESGFNAISGLFRNVVGGKVLTKADLQKPMRGIEEHLLNKNIAREAAVRLCEGVERELVGVKTGNFESVDAVIRKSLTASLTKILTPTVSLDLLGSIKSVASPSSLNQRPYVISIVGVNGVGKSTNLSKLAFYLLQNNFNLLIAACDTFRSGAVEQLRVHARNLKELSQRESLGKVELYEKGYGKDAANIAKDAVAYAKQMHFDVVLIDTAGRRHNDARLMSSLEKFAAFAQPDKILMVGEALVGSDSVAQARSFNEAFGRGRRLDGFIISKCDTVGDMRGTLVSMVHATGIPVLFLGVGQHYGDIRTLNVKSTVDMLMS
ncbi:MAG: hypothetical protein HETSPECPRED_000829 [Heterodermia speciosa]|uniref:Signal recognition particle receptor subunit alpha homolog n=1 Tax=Heterodermia speciosa TaxID=116794 RepID=A0A8H3IDM5_9LECA|nr:MAG: hypothetical protein HETSPECPRED_000829 [Heterodermia speciosa]